MVTHIKEGVTPDRKGFVGHDGRVREFAVGPYKSLATTAEERPEPLEYVGDNEVAGVPLERRG